MMTVVFWLSIIVDFLATQSWLGTIIHNSYMEWRGFWTLRAAKCATAPDDRSRRTHRLWKIWRRSSLSQKDPPFAYGCGVLMMPHDWFGWCSWQENEAKKRRLYAGSPDHYSIHKWFSAPDWSRFLAVLSCSLHRFPTKSCPKPILE